MTCEDLILRVRTRTVGYGDGKKFVEYRVLFFKGSRVVGAEDGPRRGTATRKDALKAARARVADLKKQRLFVVRVTSRHIRDGEERNCDTCAVAQALFHSQKRMGLDLNHDFRVEPYGCSERGIVLRVGDTEKVLPRMPDMVSRWQSTKRDPQPEGMLEWTMRWDDWAQARHETAAEYRERTGDDQGKPWRPSPTAFVLNLDAFTEDPGASR